MSLISHHVKTTLENRDNIINLFETRFKDLQQKIESMGNNQNVDTSHFVSKKELDDVIDDIKDCFSVLLESTPRDISNINEKLMLQKNQLEEKMNEFEKRMIALENECISPPEPVTRIPKLKIEKTNKKIL